ncbi:tetratricopeptide repeat protein [Oesophagostomum dentatum]|uniref:Tetratricopeptide repeat protein n=1 Tax=Oesophagostomum dentatum TaxID=61180 RepID=A0A0B1TA98_OESDE|nr:tetratricopeptide repeat protein [Oesophagostomum dentatum]
MTPDDEKLLPRCRQWHKEGQLKGLSESQNEENVKIRSPDPDYEEILKGYFPRVKKAFSSATPEFGAIIATLLSSQKEAISAHPYLHLAAAAYWRQSGDLSEALSCYRTAIIYAEKALRIGDESAQVSIDAILIASATLFNKADLPDAALAILEHSFAEDDANTRSPCVFLKAQAVLADAAYLKLDASREHGIEVEQVADFARIVTYFSEPFMKKLLVPPNDSNYVAELLKLHDVLLKKLGAMSCQIDLFVELAKQKENLDHLVSEKLRFNDIYGDQMKTADQIRSRMVNDRMRRSMELGYEEAKYGYNPSDYAEVRLKSVLVRLADRIMEDIEIAQRIRSMMEYNVGPRWLSTNLAALYWRVKGNPKQAAFCLIEAILEPHAYTDIAFVQLAQVILKVTGQRVEPAKLLSMASGADPQEPLIYWLRARLALLSSDVDEALKYLKLSLDRDPLNLVVTEDLLKVACSGKSSKLVISSRFPTVCCSSVVQNAVCFKVGHKSGEQCYVVDTETGSGRLIYNRCNGVYTGASYPTAPYVNIVSPFLPIYNTGKLSLKISVSKREGPPFAEDESSVQTIDTEELPLDYGGSAAFFAPRPVEWWTRAKNEMRYVISTAEGDIDWWEEDGESELAEVPPKPLSFLWIKDRREMLRYDAKLPPLLPSPSMHQIRKGLSLFPPPRQSHNLCSGVKKLSILLENQVSTWVSVTAKGEDIAKYVDLRGPVPTVAGLQPVCPMIDQREYSAVLGLDHLPAFALSDQFLFYKPEKALTDALKSLGNERDSIEHVAARLHTALMANGMGKNGQTVSWLLCVLSSLYWRVVGDAQKAVGCLQCALQTAPQHTRDVALISLANICHQAGLLHSALIAAGTALSASPNLVAIHFTIANIYASMGDYQRALEFYYSTLSLQMNFEPAKERIRAIYCHSGKKFDFQAV